MIRQLKAGEKYYTYIVFKGKKKYSHLYNNLIVEYFVNDEKFLHNDVNPARIDKFGINYWYWNGWIVI